MSIIDFGILLLLVVGSVLYVVGRRSIKHADKANIEQVIKRVSDDARIPRAAGEPVFLQDREHAGKLFKRSSYQSVGLLCLTSDALEFYGEYLDGEPCRVSLPRQRLALAWAGKMGSDKRFWIRLTDGKSMHFVTPPTESRLKPDQSARRLLDRLARWAGRQEPADLNKTVGAARLLAVTTMAAIVLGILGIAYAGIQLDKIHGPSHIATDAHDNVYLILDGKLYELDSDGDVVATSAIEVMGLDGEVTDMVWHDGAVYVGQYATGQVHRCDPLSFTCSKGLLAGGPDERPYRTFKFAIDSEGKAIHVADTARHRLAAYDMEGRLLYASDGSEPTFCFPNGLGWSDTGELLVADTNNHRVLALLPSADSFRRIAWSLATVESMPAYSSCNNRSERMEVDDPFASLAADYQTSGDIVSLPVAGAFQVWPSEVTQDRRGRLWVINSDNGMKDGIVLRFDSHQAAAPAAVALPKDADPFSLAPVTGGVLVTDMNEQRIWRVHDDLSYEAYGKGEIKATLQRLASQKDSWSLLRMAAMFLVIVGGSMVLITVIVHSVSRRKRLLTP